jgi:hypothetical protein
MTEREELTKSLQAEITQCDEFLARASEASELASVVQKRKQDAQARLKAIQAVPDDVIEEFGLQLRVHQDKESQRLTRNLPTLPTMDVRHITFQLNSTGTTSVSETMAKVVRVDTAQASWYPAFIAPLATLAQDEARESRILQGLSNLSPDLRQYGDKALSTTRSTLGGVSTLDLACQHLRTAIQKTWGELAVRARSKCSEIGEKRLELQKQSHRQEIAKCLSVYSADTDQIEEILSALSSLYKELSGPAKNPFGDDTQFLNDIATRWKLHFYNLFQALGL